MYGNVILMKSEIILHDIGLISSCVHPVIHSWFTLQIKVAIFQSIQSKQVEVLFNTLKKKDEKRC